MRDVHTLFLALKNPMVLQHFASFFFRRFDTDKDGKLSLQEMESLIPQLHYELGLETDSVGADYTKLVKAKMRKFDRDSNGFLEAEEFVNLYRWALWRKYEDLRPPRFQRGDIVGRAAHGVPIKHYEIGEKLGAGSFGVVHRVRQRSTGLPRVLKTVNKDKAIASGTPLGEVQREIDLLAMLDHPCVLKLFEWYNDATNIYIVTDDCSGGDLLDLLEMSSDHQFPIPGSWTVKIFRHCLEGIAYCHGKGVMHKDLKFENIMLQNKLSPSSSVDDVSALVIDMGLAELFGSQHNRQERSSDRAGSLSTMAPEVIRGDFSYKCDIWSMGCVIFAVYNSEPFYIPDGKGGQLLYMYPFYPKPSRDDALGVEALLDSQYKGPPLQLVQAGGHNLQELLRQMLQPNEAYRPTAQQCLQFPWFAGNKMNDLSNLDVCFAQDSLEGLLKDRNRRLVWRSTLLQAALQLPGTKVEPLARLYQSMDLDEDGCVDREELTKALVKFGIDEKAASTAATAIDFDGNGRVEWTEFVAGCLPAARELFAISLQAAFANVDRDGDGFIDRSELESMLTMQRVDLPAEKSIETMLTELDFDQDGRISFSEFFDFYMYSET